MTQIETKKTEFDWLVTIPENAGTASFISLLRIACRGSDSIAGVLHHFLYEAYWEVKRNKIDKSQIECVTITCELDDIIAGLKRINRTACKKTLIGWIAKLQSWEFIQSDGYRHTYTIFFRKVEDTFTNPPEAETPKPRGRHAHKSKDCNFEKSVETTIHADNDANSEDCNFKKQVKTTIRAQSPKVETTILDNDTHKEVETLREEIVILRNEIVDLREGIVILQSRIVKLQSSQSSEEASRADLEAKIEALYKISNINSNNTNIKEESKRENAPTRSRRKKLDTDVKPLQPELPQQEEIDLSSLSEDDKNIYHSLLPKHREWFLKLQGNGRQNYTNWRKKYKQETYVPLAENTVNTLNAVRSLSLDEVVGLEKFAYETDGEYLRKHGGFQIHNIPTFLSKWQGVYEASNNAKNGPAKNGQPASKTQQEDESALVAWTRTGDWQGDPVQNWEQFEIMTIKDAKQFGWKSEIFPLVTRNRILSKLRQQPVQNSATA